MPKTKEQIEVRCPCCKKMTVVKYPCVFGSLMDNAYDCEYCDKTFAIEWGLSVKKIVVLDTSFAGTVALSRDMDLKNHVLR